MSQAWRYRNPSVPAVEIADSLDFTNWYFGLDVAVDSESIQVRVAKTAGIRGSRARIYRALLGFAVRKQTTWPLASPEQRQVVTMTQRSSLGWVWTTFDAARLDNASGSNQRIAVLSPTPVVRIAEAARDGPLLAVDNRTLHGGNVQAGCDTFGENWASPSAIN